MDENTIFSYLFLEIHAYLSPLENEKIHLGYYHLKTHGLRFHLHDQFHLSSDLSNNWQNVPFCQFFPICQDVENGIFRFSTVFSEVTRFPLYLLERGCNTSGAQ